VKHGGMNPENGAGRSLDTQTPFFRTCPFCKTATVLFTAWGGATVSCGCGLSATSGGPVRSWTELAELAELWERTLQAETKEDTP
jgi:hypothetical protein